MGEKFYICFYHDKRTYNSSNQAHKEAKTIKKRSGEEFRVFYCALTGGYHHTSIPQAEMDRRRAAQEGGRGMHAHEQFEAQKRRHRKRRGEEQWIPKTSI